MSADLFFFDTSILVYANDISEPEKRNRSRSLIHDAAVSGSGCISTQVLAEFWVTVTQKLKVPLAADLAREQINLFSAFRIIPVDHATVLEALRIQQRWNLSYWDSQILASAGMANASVLYSEDMQNGANLNSIRVCNPFLTDAQL